MAQLDFYPISVTYKVEKNAADTAPSAEMQPTIELYGRAIAENNQLRQACVKYEGFRPYFWVIPSQEAEEASQQLQQIKAENPELKVTGTEVHTKNYFGKEVKAVKVIVNIPAAVSQLREKAKEFGTVLEADIPFARRFMIDKRLMPVALYKTEFTPLTSAAAEEERKSKVPTYATQMLSQVSEEMHEPRILAIDIETHNPLGKTMLPEEHPILMAALCGEGFRKVLTWKKFPTQLDYIEFVNSEVELLERLKQHIEQYGPDILTGYFSDVFDLPYIRARAERYKIRLDIGLDGSQPRVEKTAANTTTDITGIVHIDVFKFIRKVMFSSLQTTVYDLSSVAKEILNQAKDDVDIDQLYMAWDNHHGEQLESYCAYNLQDAQLTLNLCRKLMPNIMELTRTIGLPMFDVSRMSYSQLVEWYLIRQAREFNELTPNRPSNQEESQRRMTSYTGGFVYEPTPGLYKDIVVFDFMSLYPTIISAHNVSPDTLNCSCCVNSIQNKVPGEESAWFCTKRRGFIPTVIDEVIKRRIRVKEILKAAGEDKTLNARQMALKTIANSMYGYFGFFGARWYNIECAKAITAFGRNHIQKVIEQAKNKGFRVIYGDTDSVFLALDGKTKEDVQGFVAEVNKSLPGMMELDYEGFYPSGIFVGTKGTGQGAKKKYALISEEGRIKIRGFETVRRNLSTIAKETQEKVLDIILRENNPEAAIEYAKGIVSDVRGRKTATAKMVITTQLQKEISSYESYGPHVAAAQRMKDQGIPAGPGSVIRYVVVTGSERIRDRVKLPEEVAEGEYDPEYYINNQIVPAVEKIFDVFGYDSAELAAEKTQKKLQAWFG
ncbi:ribonuclease H-like domain-containing protein [Candidatus Woesearchaeota archaeon]|nr:ribonuclease H-like domain-containing protein [Candidatus Woesearchaeota archaeon]